MAGRGWKRWSEEKGKHWEVVLKGWQEERTVYGEVIRGAVYQLQQQGRGGGGAPVMERCSGAGGGEVEGTWLGFWMGTKGTEVELRGASPSGDREHFVVGRG
jgi:hypothetical protein